MKKYYLFFFIVHFVFISLSCNNPNETGEADITVDSSLITTSDISWITDESDIVIPKKRKLNLKADAFRMGLKGNVKKIEERHYSAEIKDDKMVVSTNLVNTEYPFDDGPSNESYITCYNQDIYFDHDGFDVKSIYYNSDLSINWITYNFYDENGNFLKRVSQDKNGKKESSEFRTYDSDSYLPWEKKKTEIENDGAVTKYYEYDNYGNVILETMKDNIKNKFPYLYIVKFLYVYDEFGNWRSRTKLIKDCNSNLDWFPEGVARRIIYYW
jgi:hypothetical protein